MTTRQKVAVAIALVTLFVTANVTEAYLTNAYTVVVGITLVMCIVAIFTEEAVW